MKHVLFASFLLLTGCSGLFAFDIPEQRVQGNPVSGLLTNFVDTGVPLSVDLAAEQAARDTGPVQRVSLSALSFSITDTGRSGAEDEDTFDFLQTVQIFVASSRSDTALEPVLVAELEEVPRSVQRIELDVTDANIKEHVEEGAVIESSATGSMPGDDVTFDGQLTITIEVL